MHNQFDPKKTDQYQKPSNCNIKNNVLHTEKHTHVFEFIETELTIKLSFITLLLWRT